MIALLAEATLRSLLLGGAVWLALRLLSVRDAQTQLVAWTVVLFAALAMPFLMQLSVIEPPGAQITLPDLPDMAMLAPPQETTPPVFPAAGAAPLTIAQQLASLSWSGILLGIYLTVTVFFMVRLVLGFMITWRITSLSQPLHDEWTAGHDVRVSNMLRTPVTFCTTIVLPDSYPLWPIAKRRAVMAHEGAHVRHGDFNLSVLSVVYRSLFWFNPMAWWLQGRIAELSESVSDDAAIANIGDRAGYAEILLDVSQGAQTLPMAVPMARPKTVHWRVERVIDDSYHTPPLSWRRKMTVAISVLPLLVVAAGMKAVSAPEASLASLQTFITPPVPEVKLPVLPLHIARPKLTLAQNAKPVTPAATPSAKPVLADQAGTHPDVDTLLAGVTTASQSCSVAAPADVPAPVTPSNSAGVEAARKNNFAMARANFRPLAEGGDHQAEFFYGKLLMQNCTGIQDKTTAVLWYTKAADAGITEAQNQLAHAYMRGDGVAQDDNKAFALLTKAANAGNVAAMVDLGLFYHDGRGTQKDLFQAIVWSVQAGQQGAPAALMNIAESYFSGQGLPQDGDKAIFYMNLALQRAHPPQRTQFQTKVENMSRVFSADKLKKIAEQAARWSPGRDSLADVTADARKVRGKNP